MIRLYTVRDGQRVAVWDRRGRVRLIDGPRRLLLFRQTVQTLKQHSATADQYLVIRHRDGHAEHLPGPIAVWDDPVAYEEVRVDQAAPISAHEAVVVYRREDGNVTRRVVRGPARFVPTEHEWLHTFRWHGSDPKMPTRKIPRALEFTRLRVIPDQMYVDVDEVRTADDALITVRLMVFFELSDIERMLDQTHDPIADFLNAVIADVMDFASQLGFDEFKQKSEQLNELVAYTNLVQRAETIGYRISKVVYRGYLAGKKLQTMHDEAIERRTQLHLEAETERQSQELADLKLEREAERAQTKREMEQTYVEHTNRLKRMRHDEALRQRRERHQARLEAKRQTDELDLEHRRARQTMQAERLRTMQGMQVDLTRYLVAQYQNPDRLIRIAGDDRPQLHVHE